MFVLPENGNMTGWKQSAKTETLSGHGSEQPLIPVCHLLSSVTGQSRVARTLQLSPATTHSLALERSARVSWPFPPSNRNPWPTRRSVQATSLDLVPKLLHPWLVQVLTLWETLRRPTLACPQTPSLADPTLVWSLGHLTWLTSWPRTLPGPLHLWLCSSDRSPGLCSGLGYFPDRGWPPDLATHGSAGQTLSLYLKTLVLSWSPVHCPDKDLHESNKGQSWLDITAYARKNMHTLESLSRAWIDV